MGTKSYLLMQLNGKKLIEDMQLVKEGEKTFGQCRYSSESKLLSVVQTEEMYPESAFFYQIKKHLTEQNIVSKDTWNETSLKDYVFFVDFKNVFPETDLDESYKKIHFADEEWKDVPADNKAFQLFENGIQVVCDRNGEKIEKTFLPFDKSNSMARESRITFIDKEIYEGVNNRLMLGVSNLSPMNLSKLYAYRGLYLTNANRIDSEELLLNAETVCVIDDDESKLMIPCIYTAKKKTQGNAEDIRQTENGNELQYVEESYRERTVHFDGEGLISPYYSELLNENLKRNGIIKDKKAHAASFQIRLPFTKGMLHEVDFIGFIKEQIEYHKNQIDKEIPFENIMIKDAFGVNRQLSKIQIILTKSMFKGYKWIKEKLIGDPVAVFFDRIKKFDHALYIGNTDLNLSRNYVYDQKTNEIIKENTVRFNYQFFNTLSISHEDFEKVIQKHVEHCRHLGEDTRMQLSCLLNNQIESNEDESVGIKNQYITMDSWKMVLAKNKIFLKHPKIKNELNENINALIRDIGEGRIEVEGSLFFLSHDLLALLMLIIENITSWELKKVKAILITYKSKKDRKIKSGTMTRCRLHQNTFYTANQASLTVPADTPEDLKGWYSIFRSPHLSRNEQCFMKAYIPEEDNSFRATIYKKWFGHLKGVLMLPYGGAQAQALGGADFDGDMVKMIAEPLINQAVAETCESFTGRKRNMDYQRRLPVIMIPGQKGSDKDVSSYVDFETVRNSFSSRVGLISNYAIKCGRAHYWGEVLESGKQKFDEKDLSKCEDCTILTGLEIDAAKTGKHPVLPANIKKLGSDYFIQSKDAIQEIKSMSPGERNNLEKTLETLTFDDSAQEIELKDYKGTKLKATHIPIDAKWSVIDRLPYDYLKEMRTKALWKKAESENQKRESYFVFQKGLWKKNLDQDLARQVGELDQAYRDIYNLADYVEKYERSYENDSYTIGKIENILAAQYGFNEVSCETEVLGKMLSEILQELQEKILSTENETQYEKIIEEIANQRWCFAGAGSENKYEERRRKLMEILGVNDLSDETCKVFTNFTQKGYMLLFYAMQYLDHQVKLNSLDRLKEKNEQNNLVKEKLRTKEKREGADYKKWYACLYKVYKEAHENKVTKARWSKEIRQKCRRIMGLQSKRNGIFDSTEKAVTYTYALGPQSRFFWEIFTGEELLPYVCEEEIEDNAE